MNIIIVKDRDRLIERASERERERGGERLREREKLCANLRGSN